MGRCIKRSVPRRDAGIPVGRPRLLPRVFAFDGQQPRGEEQHQAGAADASPLCWLSCGREGRRQSMSVSSHLLRLDGTQPNIRDSDIHTFMSGTGPRVSRVERQSMNVSMLPRKASRQMIDPCSSWLEPSSPGTEPQLGGPRASTCWGEVRSCRP